MSTLKPSSSFTPMTFHDYMNNFFIICNQKDNSSWGWFIDIEQNNNRNLNNNKRKSIFQKIFKNHKHNHNHNNNHNNNPKIKYNRSYSDIKSSELLFFMDEDKIEKCSYKKILFNIIGIIFVTSICIYLL